MKIKVRCWHKIEKRFIEVRNIDFEAETVGYDSQGEPDKYETEKFENLGFQQYTGIKDKNGKEIFDGDIIQYNNKSSYDGINFVVEWSILNLGWVFKSDFGDVLTNEYTPNGYRFDNIEIVGNVFEN